MTLQEINDIREFIKPFIELYSLCNEYNVKPSTDDSASKRRALQQAIGRSENSYIMLDAYLSSQENSLFLKSECCNVNLFVAKSSLPESKISIYVCSQCKKPNKKL